MQNPTTEKQKKPRKTKQEYNKTYYYEGKGATTYKDRITCAYCGCEVRKYGLNQHHTTKKCLKFQPHE